MSIFTFFPDKRNAYEKWCFFEKYFTDEECDKILSLWEEELSTDALINNGEQNPDKSIRDSKIFWISYNEKSDWIFRKLSDVILSCNRARYGFDLTGFLEPLQLTKYSSGGHYKWHEDNGNEAFSIRKLSLVLQLSDPESYEGGETEIFPGGQINKTRGTVTIFPSYVTHQVNPVSKGTRHSLVAWVSGPPFR